MKKFLAILTALLMLTFAACANDEENTTPNETEAPATVTVENVKTPASGTVEEFQIEGTVSATAGLDRIEVSSSVGDQDLNASVNDAEPYTFAEGAVTEDLANLNEYFREQLNGMVEIGTMSGIDVGGVTMDCICYDVEGNTAFFTVNYTVIEPVEETGEGISVSNMSYSKTGYLDEFWIKGTLTSDFELDRIECSSYAKSNALDITSPAVAGDTYYFADGLYEADLSKLTSYFVDQIDGVYTVYKTLADALLEDNSVDITITYVAYDKSGASVTQTMSYTLAGE